MTDGTTATKRAPRILFISREPVLHQHGGSTTYALSLLELLDRLGAEITFVTTFAASRSARPWFSVRQPFPKLAKFYAPGFLRVGTVYLRLWSLRAWSRLLVRGGENYGILRPFGVIARKLYGHTVCDVPWDLSTPTDAEKTLVREALARVEPDTLLLNYAFWGPVLADPAVQSRRPGLRCAILMHDLLSARVRSFEAQGRPLDCPRIEEATELGWLDRADTLLAAQAREAEAIAPQVHGQVLVLPVTMTPRSASATPEPFRCLFVGSRIAPNEGALMWLLDAVWPLVMAACPQAKLAVVGTVAGALHGRSVAGVEAVGSVPSIAEQYARAAVCLVPLRMGSGIKIKLLEALSFGKACVSTGVGVEGLEEVVDGAIAVANDPRAFADDIVRLLRDDDARRTLERGAEALAKVQLDPLRQLDPRFLQALL